MNRALKKRIAAVATKRYLDQEYINVPTTRKERREATRLLSKRILRETPAAAFERHSLEKPHIIVPEVEIEAVGVTDVAPRGLTGISANFEGPRTDGDFHGISREERRSETGRIILP